MLGDRPQRLTGFRADRWWLACLACTPALMHASLGTSHLQPPVAAPTTARALLVARARPKESQRRGLVAGRGRVVSSGFVGPCCVPHQTHSQSGWKSTALDPSAPRRPPTLQRLPPEPCRTRTQPRAPAVTEARLPGELSKGVGYRDLLVHAHRIQVSRRVQMTEKNIRLRLLHPDRAWLTM